MIDGILTLLLGIVLAAGVFSGALWSAYQVFMQAGRLRLVHAGLLALTLAAMATLQLGAPGAATAVGTLLLLCGLAGAVLERGATRLLPLMQAAFGAALVAGLPFAAQ
ncbi:hypothetical protein FDP22_11695 [Paroceanicella profunda]|uniref:Uncharacterized protein n=1 Tax=Paroceanicella profunda TaxID=2579971 RepID=A0A5B8G052_9RHOB|nr:hypothetical protein [Paroceanicella profunda]QDL92382.1 hypothetical protein FDP22_11695 [Paroceanicella profunda]